VQDEGFGRAATWPFRAGVRQGKAGPPFGPGTVTVGVGTTEPLADCGCGDGIDLGDSRDKAKRAPVAFSIFVDR
jgi:hypothetical protein